MSNWVDNVNDIKPDTNYWVWLPESALTEVISQSGYAYPSAIGANHKTVVYIYSVGGLADIKAFGTDRRDGWPRWRCENILAAGGKFLEVVQPEWPMS